MRDVKKEQALLFRPSFRSVSFNEVKEVSFIFLAALLRLPFPLSKPRPSISQVMTSSSVYFHGRAKFLSSRSSPGEKYGKEISCCASRNDYPAGIRNPGQNNSRREWKHRETCNVPGYMQFYSTLNVKPSSIISLVGKIQSINGI